jgi:hypothetical protein
MPGSGSAPKGKATGVDSGVARATLMRRRLGIVVCALLAPLAAQQPAARPAPPPAAHAEFAHGLPRDPSFFPLAVWLQDPRNAARYRELGINLYVGLWQGPTQSQLDELAKADMRVICAQNDVGLQNRDRATIVGWMHGDEPDNAQEKQGGGYGPPIAPASIAVDYARIRKADPTRPVLLNLGQGVAWDDWYGRGVRTHHPEDYAEYCKGCDLASFDIYPVTHDKPEIAGHLEYVARGVERLRGWAGGKPVFACIETTHIGNEHALPTPQQVRSEVWLALCAGAQGIVWFAHEFRPKFVEAGLLAHPEIAAAVRDVDREVLALAPVLNAPTVANAATASAGIQLLAKQHDGALFLFAASTVAEPRHAEFAIAGGKGRAEVEVLGESRRLAAVDGRFADEFAGYGVHHYRLAR